MKKWVKWIVGTVGLIAILSLAWLYLGFGWIEYIQAVGAINKLSAEQKVQTNELFESGANERIYMGILAGVTRVGTPRVWVWGDKGLRFFRTDEFSVYSFYSACNDTVMQAGNKDGQQVTIERTLDTEMSVWQQKVKKGEYIVVRIAVEGNGGNPGYARELKVNDWWAFLPINIKELCKK